MVVHKSAKKPIHLFFCNSERMNKIIEVPFSDLIKLLIHCRMTNQLITGSDIQVGSLLVTF